LTDTTIENGGGGRIEPVDIQLEMQRSYIDYAMSVIVGRALPEVRDGLKPVHRRVLYSMFDSGFRPDRGHVKCARVVGDVMGNYHPHGDTAIYDTLVRLAQPWSLRYPLIDGQGNFGSPGNDPAAAMRYCVTADARIRLDFGTVRIGDVVPHAAPDSDHDVDLKVRGRSGDIVRATRFFHSGEHTTLRLTTREGYQLTGTENHPVLCLVSILGVPTLLWQLLGELRPGDHVVLQRAVPDELGVPPLEHVEAAILAGARSAAKRVPEFVWRSVPAVKRAFLQALFEGDGSSSLLPRNTIQISYSTRSEQLAQDVQQLLLEFGVISRLCRYAHGEIKVVITNRRDALLFAGGVGFLGRKQAKLESALAGIPRRSRALSGDHVPYVADYIRANGADRWTERDWLRRHNVDRIERWERDRAEIAARIGNREVLDVVEPLVDGRFYYAEVATIEDAGVQPVYSIRVDTEDHAFVSNGFVSHNTECRLSPLAMEMLREIDQDTVDFSPNYDGKSREPDILPSRIPNLLVNGGSGIAVGMATNIPPHNLREVADGVYWALTNPEATDEELLAALLERIKGPDFPTGALIVGRDAIEEAYRTGRGSVRMRAVVTVEEDAKGRSILVVTELPYQVNPDNLAETIAALVKDGRVAGISDIADESSDRVGQRLVVTLKRDAVAKVVLNNLYKHTQLQTTFGVNALALVDGVPRTLRLDQMVRYYVAHQVEVIVRRTKFRLRKAEERAHILRALLKALDQLDAVIALIRASESAEASKAGLMELLDIDEIQATAILDMQLRRLAALERQKIIDEYAELEALIAELNAILASPARQRQIIHDELAEIVDKYGDERRTRIVPYDGDVSMEDLIAEENVVVTITATGYAKRTKTDLYRSQRRGGKGVQGAALKQDDIVAHFFVASTHDWVLFFTNKGRVYRLKAYELPEANRAARGQHVANLLPFQPGERIAEVITLRDYTVAPYLVLATKGGLVKKTKLTDFDSNRAGGIVAINLRDDDELINAALIAPDQDLLLVSQQAQSIRFHADDEALRPMGRATSGVIGMRFAGTDELLSMMVVTPGADILVATGGGYAKRTKIEEYPVQGRGGKGVLTAKIVARRGGLVGALAVLSDDELYAITSNGGVIRTGAREVRRAQRQTMGVRLMNLPEGVNLVAIARNADEPDED
jgi:DNA gyrase subunit A